MTLVLGVDGGGSKTHAVVCDERGAIVAEGRGGSSNAVSVGFERAAAALRQAVSETGIAEDGLAAACFGLAGVDGAAERARMEALVARFAPRVIVVHDSELVLPVGTPEGHGVALVCGTGSVAVGRTASGTAARAGGWGWLVDDEGSGYAIGLAALRAAVKTLDGRAGAGAILGRIETAWSASGIEDLVARAHHAATTRADVARLAEIVLDLAAEGDPSAAAIVNDAAAGAALLVTTVMQKLETPDAPVALAGGLLTLSGHYRAAVCEAAGVPADRTQIVRDPALGAAVLARRLVTTSDRGS